MIDQAWQSVAVPANEASARILLGLLQSEGIVARIKSNVPVPGLSISFRVEVPEASVQKAEQILQHNQFTDEELAQLAVNTKPGDEY